MLGVDTFIVFILTLCRFRVISVMFPKTNYYYTHRSHRVKETVPVTQIQERGERKITENESFQKMWVKSCWESSFFFFFLKCKVSKRQMKTQESRVKRMFQKE